jgi:hypothetical protein
MIPRLYPWQSQNGAAHRKNLDTPSLLGLRLEPESVPLGTMQKTKLLPSYADSCVSVGNRA